MIEWQGLKIREERIPSILTYILRVSKDPNIELVINRAIQVYGLKKMEEDDCHPLPTEEE